MDKPALHPQSRPDRNGFWVRYTHPMTKQSVRFDLGSDPTRAEALCADLHALITNPRVWDERDHPDNDGLSAIALDEFYRHPDAQIRKLKKLNTQLKIDNIHMQLMALDSTLRLRWLCSYDLRESLSRGLIDKETIFQGSSLDTKTSTDAAPALAPLADEVMVRFGLPDGFVTYVRGSAALKVAGREIDRTYGRHEGSMVHIKEFGPQVKYRAELRALFGSELSPDAVPSGDITQMKRWRCVYRIEGPDGSVHFADGCVAYDRLYAASQHQYKIARCRISAEDIQKLSRETTAELQRLYPAPQGGFAIPFPPEPPKRKRRPCVVSPEV